MSGRTQTAPITTSQFPIIARSVLCKFPIVENGISTVLVIVVIVVVVVLVLVVVLVVAPVLVVVLMVVAVVVAMAVPVVVVDRKHK